MKRIRFIYAPTNQAFILDRWRQPPIVQFPEDDDPAPPERLKGELAEASERLAVRLDAFIAAFAHPDKTVGVEIEPHSIAARLNVWVCVDRRFAADGQAKFIIYAEPDTPEGMATEAVIFAIKKILYPPKEYSLAEMM